MDSENDPAMGSSLSQNIPSQCLNVKTNDMQLAQETTATVKVGKKTCYGSVVSGSYVLVSDLCVRTIAETEVFFR